MCIYIYLHIYVIKLISPQFSEKNLLPKQPSKLPCSLLLQEICQLSTPLLRSFHGCGLWSLDKLRAREFPPLHCYKKHMNYIFKTGWCFFWGEMVTMLRHKHVLYVQVWCWWYIVILKWYSTYSDDSRDTVIPLDTTGYVPSHFSWRVSKKR